MRFFESQQKSSNFPATAFLFREKRSTLPIYITKKKSIDAIQQPCTLEIRTIRVLRFECIACINSGSFIGK